VRSLPLALAALSAALSLSTGASPSATPKHPTAIARATSLGPAALRFGRSLGSPTEGRLVGGMHLEEAPYLRITPADTAGDVRWGLLPLVTMLDRAARAVRRQFPDTVTSVGHLSREGGGEIERHRSHESGRDADVGFFVRTAMGRPLLATHFVPFRPDGSGVGWPGAYFDDAKNWALVAALVGDAEARVTHVFVAAPLRARLLAYAERMGVATGLRVRAAEVMQQPRGALPHDDHFHVRIGCPAHMSGCVENPALRVHRPETMAARGRRGEASHVAAAAVPPPTTPAHKRQAPAPLPSPLVPPGGEPEGNEPSDESEMPPASMRVPIDDVDG
jgi:penicillin-insensitive murein endopeptidase